MYRPRWRLALPPRSNTAEEHRAETGSSIAAKTPPQAIQTTKRASDGTRIVPYGDHEQGAILGARPEIGNRRSVGVLLQHSQRSQQTRQRQPDQRAAITDRFRADERQSGSAKTR